MRSASLPNTPPHRERPSATSPTHPSPHSGRGRQPRAGTSPTAARPVTYSASAPSPPDLPDTHRTCYSTEPHLHRSPHQPRAGAFGEREQGPWGTWSQSPGHQPRPRTSNCPISHGRLRTLDRGHDRHGRSGAYLGRVETENGTARSKATCREQGKTTVQRCFYRPALLPYSAHALLQVILASQQELMAALLDQARRTSKHPERPSDRDESRERQ